MDTKSLAFSTVTSITVVAAMMLNACSSGGDAAAVAPTPAPAPAPPDVLLNASGGTGGDQGNGGNGNTVNIMKHIGSGPVEIRKEGVVDASFIPFMPSANLGSKPATVSADTVVAVVGAEPAAGTLYFVGSDSSLYLSDGDTNIAEGEEIVTGLHIEQDVVLTFNLNYLGRTELTLQNDLFNQGTIQTVDYTPTDRGSLQLYVSSYIANSEIDTSGRLEGQNGGYTNIYANYSIVNHGGINTSGADNSNGAAGYAGGINLDTNQFSIENTGVLDASGGTSATSTGGNASNISFNTQTGIRNAGNLFTHGGDGITAAGSGNGIHMNINAAGDILNVGNLDAHGGSTTQDHGLSGGDINFNTYGGEILSSGDIITRGGDTQQSSGSYSGGAGGPVNITISGIGSSPVGIAYPGNLQLSGNIDTSGGNTPAVGDGNGGGAGSVNIFHSATGSVTDEGHKISLLGYDMIDTSGGNGQSGGYASILNIENMAYSSTPSGQLIPSGNIINEANIDSSGGDVSATVVGNYNGGCHDLVSFRIDSNSINQTSPDGSGIHNSGTINARNGENLETNSPPGCSSQGVYFEAYSGIINTAAIDTSGGNDRGTDGGSTGRGSNASLIEMRAFNGPISNSGTLTSKGGDGEYSGGNSQFMMIMHASAVDNSADIDSSGGDANPALFGSSGGDGGRVEIFGSDGLGSVTNSATVNIDGGTGETPGTIGEHVEGGFCIAGTC